MDHWGDPWADTNDTDDTKSPTKEAIAPPPLRPQAPILLNGFLDDAQWGSGDHDDDFGGWATSPRAPEPTQPTSPETRAPESSPTLTTHDPGQEGAHESFAIEDEGWGSLEPDVDIGSASENVVSETSDSTTTIQPEETSGRPSQDLNGITHPDDDLSTRPSTSPSEVSHTEPPNESPRTSFEDERTSGKAAGGEEFYIEDGKDQEPTNENASPAAEVGPSAIESWSNDAVGDMSEDQENGINSSLDGEAEQAEANPVGDAGSKKTPIDSSDDVAEQDPNRSLLDQLFPLSKSVPELPTASDDPIAETSARKAWYRLTRKQTMREFNNGGNDDNYTRVRWATSKVRTEVDKIVSRWALEDRRSGRSAGASFYWDQPAAQPHPGPLAVRTSHKQASIPNVSSTQPTEQPASSSMSTAQFTWSSTPFASDPWQSPSPQVPVVPNSLPVNARQGPVARLQRQEGRAVSVDLSRQSPIQSTHRRTATSILESQKIVGPLSSLGPVKGHTRSDSGFTAPLPPPGTSAIPLTATDNDPWAAIEGTPSQSTAEVAAAGDEDDDWGEMVGSPATQTPEPSWEHAQTPPPPPARHQTMSTPSPPPKSIKSSPFQAPVSKSASPIVRLRSTVSPTSARFKYNNFIPSGSEAQPIGQGILKPVSTSRQSTPERSRSTSRPSSGLAGNIDPVEPGCSAISNELDSPAPAPNGANEPGPESPSVLVPSASADDRFPATENAFTSQPAPSQQPPAGSFLDADFSFFESPPSTAPPQPPIHPDPSDPFSIFETAAPGPASEPVPFTRPPPRPVTPPIKQPLTGASNAAQRRKAEEDELIRNIVAGLPDLSYMLRQ